MTAQQLPDHPWMLAHPTTPRPVGNHLARIAVEFEVHGRTEECESFLQGDPPSATYWVVTLGRLALCRDGSWDYLQDASRCRTSDDFKRVQNQRFVCLEEAIRVASQVFGMEPEHAAWARFVNDGCRS